MHSAHQRETFHAGDIRRNLVEIVDHARKIEEKGLCGDLFLLKRGRCGPKAALFYDAEIIAVGRYAVSASEDPRCQPHEGDPGACSCVGLEGNCRVTCGYSAPFSLQLSIGR